MYAGVSHFLASAHQLFSCGTARSSSRFCAPPFLASNLADSAKGANLQPRKNLFAFSERIRFLFPRPTDHNQQALLTKDGKHAFRSLGGGAHVRRTKEAGAGASLAGQSKGSAARDEGEDARRRRGVQRDFLLRGQKEQEAEYTRQAVRRSGRSWGWAKPRGRPRRRRWRGGRHRSDWCVPRFRVRLTDAPPPAASPRSRAPLPGHSSRAAKKPKT